MYKKIIAGVMSICMLSVFCIPTSVFAEESSVIYGDANCDTKVDIRDIASLKKHLVGLEELSAKGLENCGFFNNTVSVKSLGQLIKYIIKDVDELQFSYYDDGIYDEYVPFNMETIGDEPIFDNQVWVMIKHQYSCFTYEWTAEDFKGIENIDYIDDLSVYDENETDRFTKHKYLIIYLKETGLDKVHKMIDDIENSGMIEIKEVYPIIDDVPTYD